MCIAAIEGTLEKALFDAGMILDTNYGHLDKIGWSRSSRTDKGVHSLSTVFGARLEGMWTRMRKGKEEYEYDIDEDCVELPQKINKHLPEEISVLAVAPVIHHWDARKACIHRHYEYLIPMHILDRSIYHSDPETFARILSHFVGRHHWHNFGQIERRKSPATRTHPRSEKTVDDLAYDIGPAKEAQSKIAVEPTQPEEPSLLSVAPSRHGPLDNRSNLLELEQYRLENMKKKDKRDLPPVRRARRESVAFKPAALFNPESPTAEPPTTTTTTTTTTTKTTPEPRASQEEGALEINDVNTRMNLGLMTPAEIAALPLESHLAQDAFFRTISYASHDEVDIMGQRYVRVSLQGDSFLLHQVRRMIGALILTARGVISEEVLIAAIDSPFRILTPRAPPQGLLLRDAKFVEVDFKGRDVEAAKAFARQYVYPHLHKKWESIGTDAEELEDGDEADLILPESAKTKDAWAEVSSMHSIPEVRDIIPQFDDWLQWHMHDTRERELKREQRKAYYEDRSAGGDSRRDRGGGSHRVTTRQSY